MEATNIGLLYPKVRNNIGGDIPIDVPPTKILGDVSPASSAGLTPLFATILNQQITNLYCAELFSGILSCEDQSYNQTRR